MESTKTFVEHPSGKLAVTVHAPRSLREEEAAYFHGINLEQAHKFAHLNGWQLTVDREKDDTVSAADADSFKIGDATIDGVGGKGQQAVRIEAKVGVSDGAEKTDVPIPTETSVYKGYKQDKIEMRGDRAEMSDFPLYLNTVAGGLDRRD